ncbi:MAG: hypothetical protein AB8H86_23870 [Polyangiales bacterium]
MLLLWAPSCSTPPLTEIIVNVDSSFPAGELDMVRLVVVRNGESRAVTADLGDVALPFTQGVVHRGGSLDVSLSAEGIFEERVRVEQLVPVERFVEGETLQVHVHLSPSCIGICQGLECVDGVCVGTMIDAGIVDGAIADAGVSDAPPPGECPPEPIDITGDYICAVDCADCNLRCTGDCNVTCRSGASCRVETDSSQIVADCQEGSDCSFHTTNRGGLSARCSRARCEADCDGDAACNMMCPQGDCLVDCNGNEMCSLRGCSLEPCDRDRLVCGRSCP